MSKDQKPDEEQPLYRQMIWVIKCAKWNIADPGQRQRHVDNAEYMLSIVKANVGIDCEYELDWDESKGVFPNERIIIHSAIDLRSVKDVVDVEDYDKTIAFDVKVLPSMAHGILVRIELPEISAGYQWEYTDLLRYLREKFTDAFNLRPIVSHV